MALSPAVRTKIGSVVDLLRPFSVFGSVAGQASAVYLTVLHRLMVSGSDRHANGWRNALRVPGAEAIDLDQAYKAMAWLGEVDEAGHGTAEAVEEALYRHRLPLFGAVSLAFFDTTSLWFECSATLWRGGARQSGW